MNLLVYVIEKEVLTTEFHAIFAINNKSFCVVSFDEVSNHHHLIYVHNKYLQTKRFQIGDQAGILQKKMPDS